jgi:hypothetical protein
VSRTDLFKARRQQHAPQADIVDLASDQLEAVVPAKIEAPPDDKLCEANQCDARRLDRRFVADAPRNDD